MADQEKRTNLTSSQMIRRAALELRTMTIEEKVALMNASEANGEQIKARFASHWKGQKEPETRS